MVLTGAKYQLIPPLRNLTFWKTGVSKSIRVKIRILSRKKIHECFSGCPNYNSFNFGRTKPNAFPFRNWVNKFRRNILRHSSNNSRRRLVIFFMYLPNQFLVCSVRISEPKKSHLLYYLLPIKLYNCFFNTLL